MKKIIQITLIICLSICGTIKADETIKKFSDYSLAANDSVNADILIYKGDAKINGKVNGNISVFAGNIYLGKEAKVSGEIKAYAGKVFRNEEIDENSSYYLVDKLKKYVFRDPAESIGSDEDLDDDYYDDWSADNDDIQINIGRQKYYNFFSKREVLPRSFFSYTKAEGLYLGLGSDFNFINNDIVNLGMYASGGYTFREKNWKFYLQEQLSFYNENFVIGSTQYKNTLTEDGWKIDPDLNYLAALAIHEDFYNYYGSKGYGFYTGTNLKLNQSGDIPLSFGLKGTYYHDKISQMDNATNYSLFSHGKDFTPAMILNREGNLKTVSATAFMTIGKSNSNELQISSTYETTVNSVNQDFRYEKLTGLMSGRIDFADICFLTENFRLESTSNDSKDPTREVPIFKNTSLGGTGTLPGYALNSISGNKAILSRTTLGFKDAYIDDIRFIFDLGDAWKYQSNDLLTGFDNLSLNDMKKSFGIGYMFSKSTSFSVHKRLDTDNNPYQMQLTSTMNVDDILNLKRDKKSKNKTISLVKFDDDDKEELQNDLKDVKKHLKKAKLHKKFRIGLDDKDQESSEEIKEVPTPDPIPAPEEDKATAP